jgi:5-methylthioadenosine/S-adenosylhomocysteine deaminase
LQPFLDRVWQAEAQFMRADVVRLGTKLALAEMIRSGTTLALDMYWHPEASIDVASEVGFRLMTGPIYIGFPGPDGIEIEDRLAWGRDVLAEMAHRPLAIPCVLPHGAYTVPPDYLKQAWELAIEFDAMLHIHAAETAAEVEQVRDEYGETPLTHLESLGMLSERTILAHCVHPSNGEIELAARRGASVAHCPMSNLKTAAGVAPVPAMREAGVQVLLGTDGAATSNDLDLWRVMRLAAVVHKGVSGDPTVNPAVDIVHMATKWAAQALGVGDLLGSLEVGKRADLAMISLNAPHTVPLYDIYSHLVYAVGREDVRTVLIDGRVVMRDGLLSGIDMEELRLEARTMGERIRTEIDGA